MRSTSLPGDIDSQYATPKNATLNAASPTVFWLSVKNGATAISNDTVAVRGMANKGPMDKYSATANATPYQGATLEASAYTSREPE